MMKKPFWVFLFLFLLILPAPARPAEPAGARPADRTSTPGPEISAKDMKNLISVLEDDQKREAFIKTLKDLLAARQQASGQAEDGAGEGLDISSALTALTGSVNDISTGITNALEQLSTWIIQIPLIFQDIKDFLADPQNLTKLVLFIAYTLTAILAGLLFMRFLLRRKPAEPETRPSLPVRLYRAGGRFFSTAAPHGVTLAAAFLLYSYLPSLPEAQRLALFLFWVAFNYRVVAMAFRALISPRSEKLRVLPLSDETARFAWRWLARFARYTAFYIFVNQGLMDYVLDKTPFFLLRTLLLVIFPMLATAFFIRLSMLIRERVMARQKEEQAREEEQPRDKDEEAEELFRHRVVRIIAQYWPVPAILYTWLVFILVLGGYESWYSFLFTATAGTTALILVLLLLLAAYDLAFTWVIDAMEIEEGRISKLVRLLGKITVTVFVLVFVAQFWGIPVASLLSSKTGSMFISRTVVIVIIIAVTLGIMASSQKAANFFLREDNGHQKSQKMKTLTPIVVTAIKALAIFVGIVMVLERVGVNVGPILAGAGIIGLGVGLGAQSLVKDVINGLFILFQDIINVGDWGQVGDKSGQIEAIGLRALRLRDLAGNVHVIPNSTIDTVTNMTKIFSRYVFEVGVAYRENVDEVMDILREIGGEMRKDPEFGPRILEPLEIMGLDRFDDSALIIKARFTTQPMQQWVVGREFNRRMKRIFDERGIEIPFPHRTIYMGELKDGSAPPMHIRMKQGAISPAGESPEKPAGERPELPDGEKD